MSQTTLGIEGGKHQLHLALLLRERKSKLKGMSNTNGGYQALFVWLQHQGCDYIHACLESTSTDGKVAAEVLYQFGHQVSIVIDLASKALLKVSYLVSELSQPMPP